MAHPATDPKHKLIAHCSHHKIRILKCPTMLNRELGNFKCHCGLRFEETAKYVLTHTGCPACSKEAWKKKLSACNIGKTPGNKKSHSTFIKDLKAYNPNLRCLTRYEGALKPIRILCKQCGETYCRLPVNAVRFGCAGCAGLLPKSIASYNAELHKRKIHFKAFEYLGARIKVQHLCTVCNTFTVMAPPTNALRIGKLACPICDSGTVWALEARHRVFRVRGYERYALPKLLKLYGEDDVFEDLSGKVPSIEYDGRTHKPDFYVPSHNLLIEVKSLETLGMSEHGYFGKPATVYRNVVRKRQAAVDEGYRYLLVLISDKGVRIPIPKNWYRYTRKELMSRISSSGFKLRAST